MGRHDNIRTMVIPDPKGVGYMEVPEWTVHAREDIAKGMAIGDVAKKYGKATPSIYRLSNPEWYLYSLRDAIGPGSGIDARITVLRRTFETMADRTFTKISQFDRNIGRSLTGLRIVCSKCGHHEDFFRRNGPAHPVHAAQVFINHGWVVGGGPKADRCPDCVAAMNAKPEPKAEPKQEEMPMLNPDQVKQIAMPEKKGMERADRMLIMQKLMEVYPEPDKGYNEDWTDDKVAKDMGVPVEWIAEIREQNFGPAINAAALDAKYKELEDLGHKVNDAKRLVDEAIRDFERAASLVENKIDEYNKQLNVFATAFRLVKDRKL